MESFKSQGIPYDPDIFSHGRNPHGYGHITRTHFRGYRSTSANYISKHTNLAGGLKIVTNATVDRILFDQRPGKLRATAVNVVHDNLSKSVFRARREIILSAGSYCTPAILLRSGIGGQEELDQAGVPCVLNLPGVGKNLLDHLVSASCNIPTQLPVSV
jgi:choline dehydrogenase-like flavoprotein